MYYFAICDDDPLFVQNLAESLGKLLEEEDVLFHISRFSSGEELLDSLGEGQDYTALFLDVLMGGKSGLQTARILRDRNFEGEIVYITRSPDYALESFSTAPAHYLLKPVCEQDLREALRRIFLHGRKLTALVISDIKKVRRVIAPREIVCIEVFRTQIVIHLRDGSAVTGVGALRDLYGRLGSPAFYLCHRSFIVNFGYVAAIRRYEFILKDGPTVPIAKNRYDKALLAMTEFFKK